MGIDIDALNNGESSYVKAVQNVAEISYQRMFNPFLWSDFLFNFTKYSKLYNDSLGIIQNKTQSVIETRRAHLLEDLMTEKKNSQESDEFGRRKKMTLMDILLQTIIDGEHLSDSDIKEEVNTFMFAGQDTTSTACGYLLYNIAKYPDIQERVINEIQTTYGKDQNAEITMKDLNDMHYLDLVIKESLRYHTTVPVIGRQIIKETQIEDYLFPDDTNISINVHALCHNAKFFSEPEKFWPERFETLNESGEKMHPYAFLPFSAGPRNCIGQKFALLEIKMMAVKVLQNYVISLANPNEELIFAIGLTLKVKNGIHLKFKERRE